MGVSYCVGGSASAGRAAVCFLLFDGDGLGLREDLGLFALDACFRTLEFLRLLVRLEISSGLEERM